MKKQIIKYWSHIALAALSVFVMSAVSYFFGYFDGAKTRTMVTLENQQ